MADIHADRDDFKRAKQSTKSARGYLARAKKSARKSGDKELIEEIDDILSDLAATDKRAK